MSHAAPASIATNIASSPMSLTTRPPFAVAVSCAVLSKRSMVSVSSRGVMWRDRAVNPTTTTNPPAKRTVPVEPPPPPRKRRRGPPRGAPLSACRSRGDGLENGRYRLGGLDGPQVRLRQLQLGAVRLEDRSLDVGQEHRHHRLRDARQRRAHHAPEVARGLHAEELGADGGSGEAL